MSEKLEVHFACDSNGDHTANMAECTDSQIKKFDDKKLQQEFIIECTYVYDLDIALGNGVNSADIPNPILDCIDEDYL